MDDQHILKGIQAEVEPLYGQGKVANYIPALAPVPPRQFSIILKKISSKGYIAELGTKPFSIQNISKLFILTMAMYFMGKAIWGGVRREPFDRAFNSLVQFAYENQHSLLLELLTTKTKLSIFG